MPTKPILKLFFVDFWPGFDMNSNFITEILRQNYELDISPNNPDFLFYSVFGSQYLKYDCVRVFYTGENLTPDFNLCDYALGFDHMEYENRYLRFPLFRLYMGERDFEPRDNIYFEKVIKAKSEFCNYLYSNNRNSSPERAAFFHLLSTYKKVDSGGGHLNNIGGRVKDKCSWQRKYKFSIAFENSSKSGYTTEKILQALQADTIPIYWGNPRVEEDFNQDRFINCHAYNNFDEVLEVVKSLDKDDAGYFRMMGQPWFPGATPPRYCNDNLLKEFLLNIIAQGAQAKRRTKHGYSSQYMRAFRPFAKVSRYYSLLKDKLGF